MKIYTIGFTKKSAERFFELICTHRPSQLVDVRLHNTSQLAGFAKQDDLRYFLAKLCNVPYVAEPRLAPEPEALAAYRARELTWGGYERRFLQLLRDRRIEEVIDRHLLTDSVLLCSEDRPERCHRRLVAEYLADAWGDVEIVNLM